jgi:hypothetical protein
MLRICNRSPEIYIRATSDQERSLFEKSALENTNNIPLPPKIIQHPVKPSFLKCILPSQEQGSVIMKKAKRCREREVKRSFGFIRSSTFLDFGRRPS